MGGGNKDEEAELKKAFESYDTNGNGRLSFDEFFALLKRGDKNFPEDEAQGLFHGADKNGSGDIDFGEFVDYIYGNQDFGEFVHGQLEEAAELEAKTGVLRRSIAVRSSTSQSLKEAGQDWHKLSWRERLTAVQSHEAGVIAEAPAQEPAQPAPSATVSHPIAEKTQAELVDYSVHKYDLRFAGKDPNAEEELIAFTEHLKVATGPTDVVGIVKYLAKGTAGWVFLVERKDSGCRFAMKVIRMTQALSGIKEWYISKLLRNAGVSNIVFTDEQVCVLPRKDAPPIIEAELRDAGPVPYYICLMQDFMNGGTLEGLVEDGRMTPKIMFKALEDVASTLAVMHKARVHHKDIKPENVLVEMSGGALIAAKLCDFGSADVGNSADRADDIRRFGVTMFSLATGEGWKQNRLIHEKHENLVERLTEAVGGPSSSAVGQLPDLLRKILSGCIRMKQVADIMAELRECA